MRSGVALSWPISFFFFLTKTIITIIAISAATPNEQPITIKTSVVSSSVSSLEVWLISFPYKYNSATEIVFPVDWPLS